MMSAGCVSVYVVLCVICSLHAVTSDSRFLNRLSLGGSMTKIGETFFVSSSFSYYFVFEMPNKTGVEVPIGRQICLGNHDTGLGMPLLITDVYGIYRQNYRFLQKTFIMK